MKPESRSVAVMVMLGALVSLALVTGAVAQAPIGAPEQSVVRVGLIPIASLTPIYAGDKLGYFKEEGLAIERKIIATSPDQIAALSGGSVEVAYGNVVTAIFAQVQGYDLRIVASHTRAHEAAPDNGGLVVKAESPIRALKDLEGKKVATNSLKDYNYLLDRAHLEKHGVDPNKVQWTEARFQHMAEALLSDRIDAAHMVEPFLTVILQGGKARVLSWPNVDIWPGIEIAPFFASEKWLKTHPNTIRRFVRALQRTDDYLNGNRAEKVKFTAEFTKMEPPLVEKMTLDVWRVKVEPRGIQFLIDRMVREKLLERSVQAEALVYDTAR